jgi:hypothetical protein
MGGEIYLTDRRDMVAAMLRDCSLFAIGLTLFACGGPAAPAAAPAAEPSESAQAPMPESAAAGPESKPSLEGQRESFMKSCSQKSRSQDFCNCGFEQFKQVFKDADLSKPLEPSDPRIAELQKKTTSACASKLSEEDVKDGFIRGCVAGEERKSAYCTCAWTSLRKKVPYSDFIGEVDEARLMEPKKAMVIECKGKFPAEVAKFEFMNACTKGDSSMEKGCGCRWDKIKKAFSTEEIVAGTVDPNTAKGLDTCK